MRPHVESHYEERMKYLYDLIIRIENRVKKLEKRLNGRTDDEPEPPFTSMITLTDDERNRMSKEEIAYYEGGE